MSDRVIVFVKAWHLYKQQKYVYKESINYRTILFVHRQILILCFILWPESKVSTKNNSFSADFSKKSKKRQFADLSGHHFCGHHSDHKNATTSARNWNFATRCSKEIPIWEKYFGGSRCHRHNRNRHPRWSMKPDFNLIKLISPGYFKCKQKIKRPTPNTP